MKVCLEAYFLDFVWSLSKSPGHIWILFTPWNLFIWYGVWSVKFKTVECNGIEYEIVTNEFICVIGYVDSIEKLNILFQINVSYEKRK